MFIQVLKGKTSRRDEVKELGTSWRSEVGGAEGWLGGTFGFTDDDTFFGVVRFESREAAMANSERPEQGAFAEKMGALMDGEVQFLDYDDVMTFLDGGSDDAGYVQVIQGRTDDRNLFHTLLDDTTVLHERRPEIMGGTVGLAPDGSFTETVAFTDEASARQGEQADMSDAPPEVGEALQKLMEGAEFYDLREVWFESP
jgi:hypothetical protein